MSVSVRFVRVLAIALALSATVAFAGGKSWKAPSCDVVKGLPAVSWTATDLSGLVPVDGVPTQNQAVFGLVAVDDAGYLMAEHAGTIYRSRNAGCSWSDYATLGFQDSPLRMTAGHGSVAFGWGFFSSPRVWRLDARANPSHRLVRLPDAPGDVLGLGVDPAVNDRVRIVTRDGRIWEYLDGAARWAEIGKGAPVNALPYFAAFDPANLDHVVVGMATDGLVATLDGGASWTNARGLSATGGPRNAFSGAISPVDGGVVWVMSLDLDESDAGAPSQGRHVYRSEDGGLTFVAAIDQGGDVVLTNGPLIVADPADADVVFSSFGARFQNAGTWLYRYDHAAGATAVSYTPSYFGLRALTFNPADPSVLYLGFER